MLPNDVLRVINAKALELDIPAANLAAVIHVESRGKVYGPDGLPMILYEPHLFGRRLSGAALKEALSLGLATKSQKQNKYPKAQKDRWQQIKDAAALCHRHGLPDTLVFESASYGVGQVLGQWWDELGFESFGAFYDMMLSGAEGQIEIMLRYCRVNDLIDELQDSRWPGFFRGYNGPNYKALGYGDAIERALALYGGEYAAPDGMLRQGSKGSRVRELQALLVRAGHQVKVDGDFGPATKKAVKAFQKAHGIGVDGIVGPQTQKAIAQYRQGDGDEPGKIPVAEIDGVKAGAGGLLTAGGVEIAQQKIDEATTQLQAIDGFQPWLGYGLTALSLIAAGLAMWAIYVGVTGWLKSQKTVET